MPRLHRTRILGTALAAVAVGCAGTAIDASVVQAKAKKHKVTIKGTDDSTYRFAPKKLTIKKGQTVHWSWNSHAPHNVTFDNGRHSKDANQISDFHLKFKHKGTFKYSCTIHGFTAKIVVN